MAGIALPFIGGIASDIFGGIFGSNAAQQAAQQQAGYLNQALSTEKQNQANALDFEKGIWSGTQANLSPYLSAGNQGLGTLETLLGLAGNPSSPGFGTLAQGFQAPTLQQAEQEPGYQFALGQGEQALQNSAAARGNLVSGNTLEALNNYAQNAAQQNYQNVYNRSFNTFEANQANTFNRLNALVGLGQQTGTTLGNLGLQTGGQVGNTYLTGGQQQAQTLGNIGSVLASGTIGSANALTNMFGGIGNNLMNLGLLSQFGQNTNSGLNLDSSWLNAPSLNYNPSMYTPPQQ